MTGHVPRFPNGSMEYREALLDTTPVGRGTERDFPRLRYERAPV